MSVNSFSSGTTIDTTGNIEVAMISVRISRLKRNSSRAIAYAVNVASSSDSAVVTPATTRLLSSALVKPWPGLNTDR
ncbi:hypothetical protein SVIOM74S_03377 [Streptomyces violarus]